MRETKKDFTTVKVTLEKTPDAIMDKPEMFLFELAKIPSFFKRIACFKFHNSFLKNLAIVYPFNYL